MFFQDLLQVLLPVSQIHVYHAIYTHHTYCFLTPLITFTSVTIWFNWAALQSHSNLVHICSSIQLHYTQPMFYTLCFMTLCFNTLLLNFHSLSILTPFGWLRSIMHTPYFWWEYHFQFIIFWFNAVRAGVHVFMRSQKWATSMLHKLLLLKLDNN